MPSDLLMRFLQQINKQGLTVDFLRRGMSVFLFLCAAGYFRYMSLISFIKQKNELYTYSTHYLITGVTVLQINYQTPPAGLLSSVHAKYPLSSLACLHPLNGLFVLV